MVDSDRDFVCSKDWTACSSCKGFITCSFRLDLDDIDVCVKCGNILPHSVKTDDFVCDICKYIELGA